LPWMKCTRHWSPSLGPNGCGSSNRRTPAPPRPVPTRPRTRFRHPRTPGQHRSAGPDDSPAQPDAAARAERVTEYRATVDAAYRAHATGQGCARVEKIEDTIARQADASSAGLRKLPPWKWQQPRDQAGQTRLLRFIGILFVIVGPIGIVAGTISISQGRIASHGLSALPVSFRYLFIAFAAAAVGRSLLSRHGLFRPAVRRGGWRLALALLSSLGGLIFVLSIAMGWA
jgi:hypothetical protein